MNTKPVYRIIIHSNEQGGYIMKKLSSLLLLTLSIRLLAGAALAAEIPDPDFYFNAGAGKETGKGDITYEYAFSKDPRKAAEAYV